MPAKAYYHSSLHLYITNHKGRHKDNTSEDCETDNPLLKQTVKCQEWFAFIRSNLPANLELITVISHVTSGESHGSQQTRESIKKLEAAFGGAVHIIPKDKGNLIICYDNNLLVSLPQII